MRTIRTAALVPATCALAACTSSLPQLPVAHVAPPVARPAPPAGVGRVVVDAVDAPDASVDEVLGHATTSGYVWPYGVLMAHTTTLRKTRCDKLPCVVDAPYGVIGLEVRDRGEKQAFRLDVDDKPSYVRVRLPKHVYPMLGLFGWTLAGLSLGPIAGGTAMLVSDPSRDAITAGCTIGISAALGVVGVILGATNPFVYRPGTVAAWTLSPPQ
jgi:hypothetical protein